MIRFSCSVKRLVSVMAWIGFTLLAFGCRKSEPVSTQAAADKTPKPVAAPRIAFEEVAAPSGLHFQWPKQKRPFTILETVGYGCAFLDYDNDGWQDILLVSEPTVGLFRNLKNGRFEDVTKLTGLHRIKGAWRGCAVGDYDADGFWDLLLLGNRSLALLKNNAGQQWMNRTVQAGLNAANHGHLGTSAGFMDLDANGTQDLVLLNYVKFGSKEKQHCEHSPGIPDACPPSEYKAEFAELWRNEGNGKFCDASRSAGFGQTHGKALALAFADVNDDGRMDFYIGNDGIPADLMLNRGQLRFQNIGSSSGAAYGMMPGRPIAAMSADWGDFDRDGRLDLFVTAFSDESASLLRNVGNGIFENASEATDIAGLTMSSLEFGSKWLDFDNDSWPDLAVACGHVYEWAEQLNPLSPLRQSLLVLHNQPAAQGRRFVNLTPQLAEAIAKPILGRGLATADYDNDGRIDILAVDAEGTPLLLHNQSDAKGHWIKLNLQSKGANRFAVGAKVTARAGTEIWVGQVSPASAYLSSSDPRVHFGLGPVEKLDTIVVRWPSGKKTELKNVQANQILTLSET